jgi:hypothetical protein
VAPSPGPFPPAMLLTMLTPKVTELTRAGSAWVSLSRYTQPSSKRPAAGSLTAGR